MDAVFAFLASLPAAWTYVVLGFGAAIENIVPPVPADTFVLLGGFLAARGRADVLTVFVVTWGANVVTAMLVYAAGHRFGPSLFETAIGRRLLHPKQLALIQRFYDRWGLPAIFFTRFLPGLRAVVPVFAGVSHQPALSVALPVGVASGIWYGALVWLGATAGENLDAIRELLTTTNRILLAIATLLGVVALVAWKRSRHDDTHSNDG